MCHRRLPSRYWRAPVVRLEDLAAFAHVGNVGQRLVAEAVFRDRRRTGLGVKLTVEALRELHLLTAGKGLLTEDQYRVAVHARANLLQGVAVGDSPQIDRARFSDEGGMNGFESEVHGRRLTTWTNDEIL